MQYVVVNRPVINGRDKLGLRMIITGCRSEGVDLEVYPADNDAIRCGGRFPIWLY